MAERRPRHRCWRALGALGVGAGVGAGVLGAALVWLQSSRGSAWIAVRAQSAVQGMLADGWTFDLPSVHWTFDGRVVVEGVVFHDPDQATAIGVRRLDLQLDLGALWSTTVHLTSARADGVIVAMATDADGVLNLSRAFGGPSAADPNAAPWGGLPFELVIDDLGLRDVMVSTRSAPVGDAKPSGFAVKVLSLKGGVHLPRKSREVSLKGLDVVGVVLRPGPAGLSLRGDAVWTGDGLTFAGVQAQVLGTRVGVDGRVLDLSGDGEVDATLTVSPIDFSTLDVLFHTGTRGRYTGSLHAGGTMAALALEGTLAGVDGTRGSLTFAPGSLVCLPGRGVGAPDACAGPIRPGDPAPATPALAVAADTPLRWKANLAIQGFHVEDLVPSAKGPLRLEGSLVARGGGTSWPDGLWVDEGRWDGAELDAYGVRVRALHADLALHHGVLEMRGLDLSGVAGQVLGNGTLDFKSGDLALVLHGPLDPQMLSDFGVRDLGGRGSYRAKLTGGIYTEGVPIDVNGTIDMSPVTWARDGVVVQRAHATFHVRVFNGVTDVDGTIAGDGVTAYGTVTDHADVTDLHVHVDRETVTVAGKVRSPAVAYAPFVDMTDALGEFRVAVPSHGPRTVDVDLLGGAGHLLGIPSDDAIALFRMTDDLAIVDTTIRGAGGTLLELPDLHIDTNAMVVSFDRILFHPTWRQTWTNGAPVTFRLVDGGVADASIDLRGELGAAAVHGRVTTRGALDGRVDLEKLQLSALAELFPEQLSGLDGVVSGSVELRGDASRPVIHTHIDADDIFWADSVRWLGVQGDVDVAGDVATLALDADVAGTAWLSLQGRMPVHSDLASPGIASTGPIDLGLRVAGGQLARFSNALPGLEVPAGDASGVLRVRGDIHDPDLEAQGVIEAEVAGLQHRARAEFDVHRDAGVLDAQVDVFDGYDALVEAGGTARTRLGEVMDWLLAGAPKPDFTDLSLFVSDLDVSSWLDHIPVTTIRSLVGSDLDVSGDLDGRIGVRGSPRTPTLDVDVNAALYAGGTPADVHLALAPAALGYDLDLTVGDGADAWLTAQGRVPIAVDLGRPSGEWGVSTFDLRFGGSGVPLDVARAILPEVEVQRGVLVVQGRVGGTLVDPQPDVRATISDAALRYRPFGIDVKNLGLKASVGPDRAGSGAGAVRVTLESLQIDSRPTSTSLDRLAQAGPSRMEASGSLTLAGWKPDSVLAQVDLNNAWLVATDTNELRASGTISTSGTWPDLLVDGRLSVDQGRFEVNTAELWASADLQLDPSIAVHRVAGVSRSLGHVGPHWYDGIHGHVALDLGRNTNAAIRVPVLDDLGSLGASVTRADIDARMGGQLDIGAKGLDLSIQGDLELLEGRVQVLASRFDLVDGSHISFFGKNYVDPQLDVAGAMVVGGGEVRLHLTGTPSDPTFVLSSDAFGSDAELFTILLTGQAPEDLSSQQGKAALQAVGDLLLNNVLGGVNLGSVSVESDGTVRVGLPVYRTVYVETTVTPAPKLDQNHVTVLAEWSLMPRLILAAAYGDRRVWGNIFWEIRFDGPRADIQARKRKRGGKRHTTPTDPGGDAPPLPPSDVVEPPVAPVADPPPAATPAEPEP